MEPIYDYSGRTVAWLTKLYVYDRNYRAFVNDREAVSSLDARHLGYFQEGFFRDSEGYVVAFVEGAEGGPLLPLIGLPLTPPQPPTPPAPPITPLPPLPPLPLLSWSDIGWEAFLSR